jgi:hypothetical protein
MESGQVIQGNLRAECVLAYLSNQKPQPVAIPLDVVGFGVYLLFRGGQLIYVGQSNCIYSRIVAHKRLRAFDSAYYISCENRSCATKMEAQLIRHFLPPENKQGRGVGAPYALPDWGSRTCQYAPCGKTFTVSRPWKQFCSTECRMKFHGRLPGTTRDKRKAATGPARKPNP